jgi:hypothetical protein
MNHTPGSLVELAKPLHRYNAVMENLSGWYEIRPAMLGVFLHYDSVKQSSLILFDNTKVWIPNHITLVSSKKEIQQ